MFIAYFQITQDFHLKPFVRTGQDVRGKTLKGTLWTWTWTFRSWVALLLVTPYVTRLQPKSNLLRYSVIY